MNAPSFTASDIVKKYIELRAHVQEMTKQFEAQLEPYKAGMQALEGAAANLLRTNESKALSTEFGTCFFVNKHSIKCEDHDAFLAFVRETENWGMLTKHVAKDAVEEWMEAEQKRLDAINQSSRSANAVPPQLALPPPGLKAETIITVQFRKA